VEATPPEVRIIARRVPWPTLDKRAERSGLRLRWQAFIRGEDDNADPEMLAAARDFRALTQLASRPTVLVPAHPTKGARKDGLVPRGGSTFLNEIDGNLAIWTEEGFARVHTQGKHRGADFEAVKLEMVSIEPPGLVDEKGRQMPATVARPMLLLREEAIIKRTMTNEDRRWLR
jgi:hypothetical protein